jgi:hypothetical protein
MEESCLREQNAFLAFYVGALVWDKGNVCDVCDVRKFDTALNFARSSTGRSTKTGAKRAPHHRALQNVENCLALPICSLI